MRLHLHSSKIERRFKDPGTGADHSERPHRLPPLLLQLLRNPMREAPQAVHHLAQGSEMGMQRCGAQSPCVGCKNSGSGARESDVCWQIESLSSYTL
jgi:hypothetical protein